MYKIWRVVRMRHEGVYAHHAFRIAIKRNLEIQKAVVHAQRALQLFGL